jgi:adenine-specific DNA-methyltransferase
MPTRSRKKIKRYSRQRECKRPRRVKEDKQLYLVRGAEPQATQTDRARPLVGRYHQSGKVEKTLGAVYTPPRVAAALVRWAVRSPTDRVLDPSCGEGVFLAAARTRLADLGARRPNCVGVDIDPKAAAISGAICCDFFDWVRTAPKFDAVVGNPPFIRSHLFPETSRTLAFAEMARIGVRPSRLMSTWSPFLALCCRLLVEDGRLAMVIPEELLHVSYADGLRRFLLSCFRRVIVCFPPRGIFPEVQQGVILLLCDNDKGGESGLLTMNYTALEVGQLDDVKPAAVWEWNHKWTHLFLSSHERTLLNDWWSKLDWRPLSDYGCVEVGVVTGDNDFFIVDQEKASRLGEKYLMPIVTSAKDLRGIAFGSDDFNRALTTNRPTFLLKVVEPLSKLPTQLRTYLENGERLGVSDRYKCRIRDPWYAVPSVWASDALMLRQAGEMPRVVHLAKKCTATDTIHRVTWRQATLGRRHAVSFMNTWTLLAAELTGRSYGGGVLELMPSEANRLPIPEPIAALEGIFEAVDERVRARDFFSAVSIVDGVVAPAWMLKKDRETTENILVKLIERRKFRHHAND